VPPNQGKPVRVRQRTRDEPESAVGICPSVPASAGLLRADGQRRRWSVRTLRDAQRMSPARVMRDPYILDFLGLRDTWRQGDSDAAIIREMESFLLALGAGVSFVARQKRIPIDDEDFHLGLLFHNCKLRRLMAVELKIGEFKSAYKGQMELYRRRLVRCRASGCSRRRSGRACGSSSAMVSESPDLALRLRLG